MYNKVVSCSLGLSLRPGARNFLGWPGKITPSPEARKYFSKPGIFQNRVKFLHFMAFTIVSEIWLKDQMTKILLFQCNCNILIQVALDR